MSVRCLAAYFLLVAKWNVKIYPDRCIDCTLCDDSCPFGAIDKTTPLNQSIHPKEGKTRLAIALVALPFLIGGLAWFSSMLSQPIAMGHEKVRVAYQMEQELGQRHVDQKRRRHERVGNHRGL